MRNKVLKSFYIFAGAETREFKSGKIVEVKKISVGRHGWSEKEIEEEDNNPWFVRKIVAEARESLTSGESINLKKLNFFKSTGAPNESVPHIICSPEESCWLAKIQVFR